MGSTFVISLDFELLWGVRDHATRQSYGQNILGARRAIPRMLDLFAQHGIAATWATVGFVFCRNRDELMESLPPPALRPSYSSPKLSSYAYLNEVGTNEQTDPFYFGASLIEKIRQTPNQEIATHTLSHYYCLEDGQTLEHFKADLETAIAVADRNGIALRSIVFPRNQYDLEHVEICRRLGISRFRGTPRQWVYQAAPGADQTPLRRAIRLFDAHTDALGDKSFAAPDTDAANVPASQFLRPCSGKLAVFHPLHRRALRRGMSRAARTGRSYHLWWHPHNLGRDLKDNLRSLEDILSHYKYLRDEYGMSSHTMGEATT